MGIVRVKVGIPTLVYFFWWHLLYIRYSLHERPKAETSKAEPINRPHAEKVVCQCIEAKADFKYFREKMGTKHIHSIIFHLP